MTTRTRNIQLMATEVAEHIAAAARISVRRRQRDTLLQLISQAPVSGVGDG